MKRLVIISDYPPFECGIAEYTRYLVKSLSKLNQFDIFVVSEGGIAEKGDSFQVFDAYSRTGDFKSQILKKIDEINPEIVHFQHAPDLFPDSELFLSLIESIAKKEIAVFVTLHTADVDMNQGVDWNQFYTRLLKVSHIIVHNRMSQDSIAHHNISTGNTHIIEHGTAFMELPEKGVAKERLGIEKSDFVFLMFGFIHLLKNHHTIVRAFNGLKKRQQIKLLVAGRAGGNRWYNRLYIFGCKLLSLFSKKILWHTHFIKDDEIANYFAAADVLLLPYWQKYPSASGIFHLGIGANLPVICSDSVKFSEIKDYIDDDALTAKIFVKTLDVAAWERSMKLVASDKKELEKIHSRLFEYAQKTSWDTIAKKHAKVFVNSSEES